MRQNLRLDLARLVVVPALLEAGVRSVRTQTQTPLHPVHLGVPQPEQAPLDRPQTLAVYSASRKLQPMLSEPPVPVR